MNRLVKDPAVLERQTFNGILVKRPDSFGLLLQSPGDELWGLMVTPLDLGELIDAVTSAYPAEDRRRLAEDVRIFVDRLLDEGFLRWC